MKIVKFTNKFFSVYLFEHRSKLDNFMVFFIKTLLYNSLLFLQPRYSVLQSFIFISQFTIFTLELVDSTASFGPLVLKKWQSWTIRRLQQWESHNIKANWNVSNLTCKFCISRCRSLIWLCMPSILSLEASNSRDSSSQLCSAIMRCCCVSCSFICVCLSISGRGASSASFSWNWFYRIKHSVFF